MSVSDLVFRTLRRRALTNFSEMFEDLGSPNVKGFSSDALQVARRQGVCLEEDSPSSDREAKPNYHLITRAIGNVLNLRHQFQEGRVQNYFEPNSMFFKSISTLFPHLEPRNLLSIFEASKEESSIVLFDRLAQANCGTRRISVPSFRVKKYGWGPAHWKLHKLDQHLSAGAPAIISIRINSILIFPYSGNHAMTVFGRELRDGKCQYMVRNTWEDQCAYLAKKYDKTCNNYDGTFWIDEETLREGLDRVYLID